MDRVRERGEEKTPDPMTLPDADFRALVVYLILTKDTERAVDLVSRRLHVRTPKLGIGPVKGKKKALAVYSVSTNSISFADQDQFFDPFVVLHEMYHCIRSASGTHRGTEKNADKFALDYIEEYKRIVRGLDIPQARANVD